MGDAPLTGWVISDGRRGILNQALGVAEACARQRPMDIQSYTLTGSALFKALPPAAQGVFKSTPQHYGLPIVPRPDAKGAPHIIIGCGRQAIAPLVAFKKAHPATFTVYVQAPRQATSAFDLVICPEHDGLTGPNVETMIGSPNRITLDTIRSEAAAFDAPLSRLPKPRVAMLIGGNSKTHALTRDDHAQHVTYATSLIAQGCGLMISTSRRTPDWAVSDYQRLGSESDAVWHYHSGTPNPYFAFLGTADAILVTQDSTNMLTEACATGTPVFSLFVSTRSGDGRPTKFDALYQQLSARCGLAPFSGALDAQSYAPLDETARIAARVWDHYDQHG